MSYVGVGVRKFSWVLAQTSEQCCVNKWKWYHVSEPFYHHSSFVTQHSRGECYVYNTKIFKDKIWGKFSQQFKGLSIPLLKRMRYIGVTSVYFCLLLVSSILRQMTTTWGKAEVNSWKISNVKPWKQPFKQLLFREKEFLAKADMFQAFMYQYSFFHWFLMVALSDVIPQGFSSPLEWGNHNLCTQSKRELKISCNGYFSREGPALRTPDEANLQIFLPDWEGSREWLHTSINVAYITTCRLLDGCRDDEMICLLSWSPIYPKV